MPSASSDWIAFAGARGVGDEELAAVEGVLRRRTLYRGAGLAPPVEVDALERELGEALGRRYALTLNSGTSALVAGLKAMGVGRGDEVVLPSYGWLTEVSAVLELGAIPVLAPIGWDLNLDPSRLGEAVTPRTKAVMCIGACGLACDVARLRDVTRATHVPLLEDACQALGARRPGERSDVEVHSFQAFKIVTGGEGGALVTDDEAVYRAALCYHDAGLSRFAQAGERSLKPVGVGLNLRMSEIVAALVRVQLRRLPSTLERLAAARDQMVRVLTESHLGLRVRTAPPAEDNGTYVVVTCPSPEIATQVRAALHASGCPIELAAKDDLHCATGWLEYLTRERFEHRAVGLEASLAVLERTLTLPINWAQDEVQLDTVRVGLGRVSA